VDEDAIINAGWKLMKNIFHKLHQQFELPQYTDDLQRQRANLLVAMIHGGMVLVLVTGLVTLLNGITSPWVYLSFAATLVLLLFFRLRLRRGPLELIGYLLVQSGLVLVTVVIVLRGTVLSPVAIAYLLVIIAAGLLLDRRALAATVIASILAMLGLALAEEFGFLQPAVQFTPLITWFTYSTFFILTALIIRLVLQATLDAIRRAQDELQQRQLALFELAQSEERYRNFIEHSFEGVWLLAFDEPIPLDLPPEEQVRRIQYTSYIAECNDALARMYGYRRRVELLGRRLLSLYGGTPNEQNTRATLTLVRSGYRSSERETQEVNRRGEPVYFLNTAVGIIEDNHLVGLWGVQRDVTTRRLAEQALQRRSNQLASLNRIGAAVSSLQDIKGVLLEVLDQLRAVLPLDTFFAVLYDQQTHQVSYPLLFDAGRYWDQTPHPVRRNRTLYTVLTERRSLLINRTPQELEVDRAHLSEGRLGDMSRTSASLIFAPMQVGARLIGALSVQSYTLNAYTDEHLDFLTLASQQIAIAIDNARLYEGLQRELHERVRAEAEVQQLNQELEQRVQDRTAQLEAAVRELESFSYSVSHDLRAPLRAIDGYSRLLLSDYQSALDGDAQICLDNVRIAAQRMGSLIDDLLMLSRITRTEIKWGQAALSELAQEILNVLRQQDPERVVETRIQPDLDVRGDPNLLRIVLENLLGNAWKFTAHKPQAMIEFGAMLKDGRRVFYVRDNGAGFDMRYADKLFTAFQRLHGVEEFDGTGIGLANIKRIINRHGGEVWGEGEVDKGATFYFTLPGKS
jgi:PAS domain S-box-containing protein